MAVKAFILIDTQLGTAASVTRALRRLDLVLTADAVAGSHDVIAVIEGPDMNAIGDFVTGEVHSIEGVTHTVTSPALGNP
jgi:DNA-binding Lrp family transcriptional regulator